MFDNDSEKALGLTKKACSNIRQYKLFQKWLSKMSEKRTVKMLKNVKIGDILFWLTRSEEVTLVENPSELSTITFCTCQRYNKEIVQIRASLLRQISNGNYYQVHYVDNKGEVKTLELIAKQNGFRVKIKEQRDGFNIRFYGNSQEEVDDFVNLVVKNDLVLF